MIRNFFLFAILLCLATLSDAQTNTPASGMALSPARFELEMKPGTETTVVVYLDYRGSAENTAPARIVATLNDWNMTNDGRVEYFRAGTRPGSASPWMIYSPGEATVAPGTVHQIRVTISVPVDAAPGDHLASLIIEQRPGSLKKQDDLRQMIVRYRMASVFYIKVPNLTKKGSIEDLYAESKPDGIVVTPLFKNSGNSVVRPIASVKVLDTEGKVVADLPESEQLPILAGSQISPSVLIDKLLAPGNYTVKYHVDFQDGTNATEGVTDLVVKGATHIAAAPKVAPKP